MASQNTAIDLKHKMLVYLILDQSSIGRYKLAQFIGTTKSRTRSLLENISEKGFAESNKGRGGTRLTKKGKNLVKDLKKWVYLDLNGDVITIMPGLVPEGKVFAIMLLNVDNPDTTGIYERDLAVREGASGAITLIKNNHNKWIFPGEEENRVHTIRVVNDFISDQFNMMIICFATNLGSACSGGAAAAVYHLEGKIQPILN